MGLNINPQSLALALVASGALGGSNNSSPFSTSGFDNNNISPSKISKALQNISSNLSMTPPNMAGAMEGLKNLGNSCGGKSNNSCGSGQGQNAFDKLAQALGDNSKKSCNPANKNNLDKLINGCNKNNMSSDNISDTLKNIGQNLKDGNIPGAMEGLNKLAKTFDDSSLGGENNGLGSLAKLLGGGGLGGSGLGGESGSSCSKGNDMSSKVENFGNNLANGNLSGAAQDLSDIKQMQQVSNTVAGLQLASLLKGYLG